MDTISYITALLLTIFITTDIAAGVLLFTSAAKSAYSYIALNERAAVAGIQAISGSLLGILGANRIFDWHLPEPYVLITLSIAVLLQAVPSLVWLALYFFHKFDNVEAD